MSQQYYRDPDIIAYAKKRASGYCECCDKTAPFKNSDNSPFLETHHLVPLAYGGNDLIDNVCAVCPICHRMLHYCDNRIILTDEIKNKLCEKNRYS